MTDTAKLWSEQFIDGDGAPYDSCYAQFFNEAGISRKPVWTDRDKALPALIGSTADVTADEEGRISAYGDGIYKVVVRAAGDPGTNTPIAIFEGLQIAEVTAGTAEIDALEESLLSGQGRQAAASSPQSGTTLDLSKFAADGSTYLVEGTSALLTFRKVSVEGYTDGAVITLECLTNPFKLRAKRAGDGSSYNLEIGTDFLMSVGSSITLELRNQSWYERARKFFDAGYQNLENTSGGVTTAATIVAPGESVRVRGTGTIDKLYWIKSGEMAPPGQKVTLYFAAGAVVSESGNIDLDGPFTAQSGGGSSLTLMSTGSGWNEAGRKSNYVPVDVTQTLGAPSAGNVSVAGTYPVYYTGSNFAEVKRLTNPGTIGRIIHLIFNGFEVDGSVYDGPAGTYTARRKYIRHAASTDEGYIKLKHDVDFGTLPGDSLRLQLLLDEDGVLYWQEIDRSEVDIMPKLAAAASITIWRNYHVLTNPTATKVDISEILPARRGGTIISFFYGGPSGCGFVTGGNCTPDGDQNNVNAINQIVSFVSWPDGVYGGIRWGGIKIRQPDE